MPSLTDRYPRSLSAWLKCDDKQLLEAVASGQSVLEAAEDLLREHVLVLGRCSDIGLFEFTAGSEEWAEFVGLALAGVPLKTVVDWCSASDSRLAAEEIEAMAMGDLRPEFYFARELGVEVPNSDSVADLSWLINQPASVKSGYKAACKRVIDCFDVLTPATLKAQVLGQTPAALDWTGQFPVMRSQTGSWGKSRGSKSTTPVPAYTDGYAKPAKKRYRKKAVATGTRTIKAKTGRAYSAYRKSSSARYAK